MTPEERRQLLSRWVQPSSESEQLRQERALRMVRDAIKAHAAFKTTSVKVYAKGSYANQTNVRLDSDVDIVVENHDLFYWTYLKSEWTPTTTGSRYEGIWTPTKWRSEVTAAIVNAFGTTGVDTSGGTAVKIEEKTGSRPSTDVVPAFQYRRYDSADRSVTHIGSKVFKKDLTSVVNWPQQQLDNGRAKNTRTAQRYKRFVRALKNAENTLVGLGRIQPKPSYLMECLVFNVPDDVLTAGSDLVSGFRGTLLWMHDHLNKSYNHNEWREPNRLKWAFGPGQKWELSDAQQVVLHTIAYLYA